MSELFDRKLSLAKAAFKQLVDSRPKAAGEAIQRRAVERGIGGVYVFSEPSEDGEVFMYVGQSNGIAGRLKEHCGRPSQEKANFAYKLTVEATGLKPIPGSPNATKISMFDLPEFERGFDACLHRISMMNFRWVEIAGKLEKNLLEIYAAVTLKSRFNDFH